MIPIAMNPPNPLSTLLESILRELKSIADQHRFLKARFAELVMDKERRIRFQRQEIADLTAQRDRFRQALLEHGIEIPEKE